MGFFRLLIYFLKEGFLGVKRHKTLHLFAIFIVTLSLFVLGFSRYITSNIYGVIKGWEESLEMRIILKEGVLSESIEKLCKNLRAEEIVEDVKIITPEEALKTIEKISPSLKNLSFKDEGNPLPYSISIKLKKPINELKIENFLSKLKKMDEVEEAIIDWLWIKKLRGYLRFLTFLSWLLFIALGVASIFTVTAIIRIIGLSRKDEISILYSLGVTPSAIRGPFVTSGIFIGLFSSILSIVLVLGVHFIIRKSVDDPVILELLSKNFLTFVDQISLIFVGIVLGGAGGSLSLGSVSEWKYSYYI